MSLFDLGSILVLGRGYVGSAVAMQFPKARTTQRSTFELGNQQTWTEEVLSVPIGGVVLWTFPAASTLKEEQLALQLYDQFFHGLKVIIYGSTSSYRIQQEEEWVTEETALDTSQVRTRTEEALRMRGACILQLAGIFGPGRDPVSWYQRGLIQAGRYYLNLIHLQDIVSITSKIFQSDRVHGERFNLSNGKPKLHLEIVQTLKKTGKLPQEFSIPSISRAGSKRVSNTKIKKFLSISNDDFINFP